MPRWLQIWCGVCAAAFLILLGFLVNKWGNEIEQHYDEVLVRRHNTKTIAIENAQAFEAKANEVMRLQATLNVIDMLGEWEGGTDYSCFYPYPAMVVAKKKAIFEVPIPPFVPLSQRLPERLTGCPFDDRCILDRAPAPSEQPHYLLAPRPKIRLPDQPPADPRWDSL